MTELQKEGLKLALKYLEGEYLINCIDGDFMSPKQKKELETAIKTIKQMI